MQSVDRGIIERNVDVWTAQSPHASKEQIFKQICRQLDSGESFALQCEKFVMMVKPVNDWLGEVHIFSENKKSSVIELQKITRHIFENTPAIKLYGNFTNKKILSLALRAGWKHEGTLINAFMNPNGELSDLYISGVSKQEFVTYNREEN
jgi:hypothetical protein